MERKRQIEEEFVAMQNKYNLRSKTTTGKQDVLQYLVDRMAENYSRAWYWSWEFVGKNTSKGGYLSHRGPARASDLALHSPELVEDRRIGRFKVYRLREENIDKIIEALK
jgi:hypothetical protein